MSEHWAGTYYRTFDLMDHPIEEIFDCWAAPSKTTYVNVYMFKGDLEQVLR